MPLLSNLIGICLCFLMRHLHAQDRSYSPASQDLHTEDIQPSINNDVLMPSAITKSIWSSINSRGVTPYPVTDSTRSSTNSDGMTSSITDSTQSSTNSDGMTSSITDSTQSSTNSDGMPSSITDSTRSSTNSDGMTSSLTDSTRSSTNSDGMTSSITDSTQSSTNSDGMISSKTDSIRSSTNSDGMPSSITDSIRSSTNSDGMPSSITDSTHSSKNSDDMTSSITDSTRSSTNSDGMTSSITDSTQSSTNSDGLTSSITDSIRSSTNSDGMTSSITDSTRSSTNSDSMPFSITDSTRSSTNFDGMTSSITDSTRSSTNSDGMTSSITDSTRSSTNSDGVTSSITDSIRSSTNSDGMPSSITDFTRSSTNSDGMTYSITESTLSSRDHDGITSTSITDSTLSSRDHDGITSTSITDSTRSTINADGMAASSIECLVVAGSTYLFLGEDLVVTCELSDHCQGDYTAANISFKHSYPLQPESPWECVPGTSIHMLNETAAKLIISNVTFNDAQQYTCFAGDTFCQFGVNSTVPHLFGFLNDVNIEYTPQNVTDFRCEVYNWDESMVFSWKHPVQYENWSNIEVNLLYSTTTQEPNQSCPEQTSTECRWVDFTAEATYTVQVRVTNTPKHQTVSTTFTCRTIKNVKPAPIEDLSIEPGTDEAGCLIISWTHPRIHRSKVYRIQHSAVGDGQFTILTDNFTENSYIWCGYHPYTHHNFSIDCLPAGDYSGYFSDPVFKDVWTPMTEPDLGPSATNGSFTSTQCVDGLRNVTLMWQAVDPVAQNGNITGYLITLGHENLTSTEACVFSATVVLSCQPVYVAIFASNQKGLSVTPTILLISTTTVSTQIQNSFAVEIKSTETLYASWEEKDEVKGEMVYTIFWCKGRLEQSCEDEIHWREVPAGDTEFRIPVESSHAGEYIYGISGRKVQTEMASNVFWSPCLFRRNPPQLPPINTMNVKSLQDSAYVTWSAERCYYQYQVRYTIFVVKWCRTTACHEPNQISSATVPAGESAYTVAPLPVGVNYSFTVQPVSFDTPGGEVDPWKVAVLSAKDPGDSVLSLGAILGGLASAVVVLTLVIFVYRCCQKRRNRIKKLTDTQILHFPDGVAELGFPLSGVTSEASPDVQQMIQLDNGLLEHDLPLQDPGYVPYPSTLPSEIQAPARPQSNGYSRFMGSDRNNLQDHKFRHEDRNNLPDQEFGQSEQDPIAEPGNTLHSSILSSERGSHMSATNSYSRVNEDQLKESNNFKDRNSGQSEGDSVSTDCGYMQHQDFVSSDERSHTRTLSNSYSMVIGNEPEVNDNEEVSSNEDHTSKQSEDSAATDPGYMPHQDVLSSDEGSHTTSPPNSYSRVIGNEAEVSENPEVSDISEDHSSRQSEQDSTWTDTGYMPHQNCLSSDEDSHTSSPSNSYSKVIGTEAEVSSSPTVSNNPDVSNNFEDASRKSEEYSPSIDHGYTTHQDFLCSDERSYTRSSYSYSTVTGSEADICNNAEGDTFTQSEADASSIDLGYMPHRSFLPSDTENMCCLGASAPSAMFTNVPSNTSISVLHMREVNVNYNKDEETYQEQFPILTSMDVGDDYITDEISFEETFV